MPRAIDMIGEKWGNLTVAGKGPANEGSGGRPGLWLCICDCGMERVANRKQLKNGQAATCGRAKCPFRIARARQGQGRAMDNQPKARWGLSPEETKILVMSPCFYCGVSPAGGFDRRTWLQDYTADNARACCAPCQMMKGKLGARQFLKLVKKIAEHQGMIAESGDAKRAAGDVRP